MSSRIRCDALVALVLEERHIVGHELHELVEHALQQRLHVDRSGIERSDLLLE